MLCQTLKKPQTCSIQVTYMTANSSLPKIAPAHYVQNTLTPCTIFCQKAPGLGGKTENMFFKSDNEQEIVSLLAQLNDTNPFLPERISLERKVLGKDYKERDQVWHARKKREWNPNVARIQQEVENLTDSLQQRLVDGAKPGKQEWRLYRNLAYYRLYYQYEGKFYNTIMQARTHNCRVDYFKSFKKDYEHFLKTPSETGPVFEPGHLFAIFFQVRRAFHYIFDFIIGGSLPVARLRAEVWHSIFTHNMARYQRSLYARMSDIATIITGLSGTGKDLVAEAIGRSRYIDFDENRSAFVLDFEDTFFPLHLPALSPTLIESELFGHRRGAFTGAHSDHKGYLELCPPLGAVFLDEIGEVDSDIQVKLLRVLQNRTFQRLGEAAEIRFQGKIIAATNRNLAKEIASGRFREDFFYRLCSDQITMPSLKERLDDDYGELERLVGFMTKRIAGEEEAGQLSNEVLTWVNANLGRSYSWPGNVRELEQCVRNILIRGAYKPNIPSSGNDFSSALLERQLTADELLNHYCFLVYNQCGSYQESSRLLGIDRRTVRTRVKNHEMAHEN